LLIAWWSTAELAAFRRARRALAVLTLAAGCVIVVALAWPASLGAWQPRYLVDLGWTALPFAVAVAVLAISLAWGLYAAAGATLLGGTIVGMALLLVFGISAHNRDFNAAWDFPGLAAAVERQAEGGEIGVFGGRWFALDYYLGRPVHSAQSLAEFNEFVQRPERPVMITNQRTWNGIRASSPLPLCALDARPLGSQTMIILRASPQCPPAPRTPASSSARP